MIGLLWGPGALVTGLFVRSPRHRGLPVRWRLLRVQYRGLPVRHRPSLPGWLLRDGRSLGWSLGRSLR